MKLLIVESPGKIKKIREFLASGWQVAASVGHVRDLPEREIGVHPPDFKPYYVNTQRGQEVLNKLSSLVSQADEVFLATDPDREGEAIAWHLKEALKLNNPHRITYTEITETAVKKAMDNPGKININLVRAQEGRRVLDRLFGYTVSPVVKRVSGQNLTAGRVQSPALRLVVEREAAIKNFKSTTHFGVELTFPTAQSDQENWKAVWNTKNWLNEDEKYFLDRATAEKIAAIRTLTVASYDEGKSRQSPPPPFITSTLQQAASNVLKIDPKRTMEVAQKLYEGGHITYMRTDNPNLSEEAIRDIRKLATDNNWPIPAKPRIWKSKEGAQEAHEAIRPTHVRAEQAGDNELERALYKLIRVRALACQLDDAQYATTKTVLKTKMDGKDVIFEAKGRRLISPGWRLVLDGDQADETADEESFSSIPVLLKGEDIKATKGELKTKKTNPPDRYTQASLIRDLERKGIGRPSTYAAIMSNITTRGYITENKKRQLESTETGDLLVSYLSGNFGFANYDYTRNLETQLDDIANGKDEYLSVVTSAYQILSGEIDNFVKASGEHICCFCGKVLNHYQREASEDSKGYNFWGCSNQECGATVNDDHGHPGIHFKKNKLSDQLCTECNSPLRHIEDMEKGWNFWGCSNQECKTTYPDDHGHPGPKYQKAKLSEHLCPNCNSPLRHIENKEKGWNFWGCSNRACNTTLNDANGRPATKNDKREMGAHKCPKCGNQLQYIENSATDNKVWTCSNQNCGKSFKDQNGKPDIVKQRVTMTDSLCPKCQGQLRHIEDFVQGWNIWSCTNRTCKLVYNDNNGQPGEIKVAK